MVGRCRSRRPRGNRSGKIQNVGRKVQIRPASTGAIGLEDRKDSPLPPPFRSCPFDGAGMKGPSPADAYANGDGAGVACTAFT